MKVDLVYALGTWTLFCVPLVSGSDLLVSASPEEYRNIGLQFFFRALSVARRWKKSTELYVFSHIFYVKVDLGC